MKLKNLLFLLLCILSLVGCNHDEPTPPEPTPTPEPQPEPTPEPEPEPEPEPVIPLVVQRAMEEIGKPYIWGAAGPDGYDDSGLVNYCLTGKHTHEYTNYIIVTWPETTNPEPGDIVINTSINKSGIYIGNNQMIWAPDIGDVVKYSEIPTQHKFVKYNP